MPATTVRSDLSAAAAAAAQRPHIVVIGGGFAGLAVVRGLARAAVRITLIDRANHHVFQPLLYQVAGAGLSATDIAAPLRYILRHQRNVAVWMAEVTAIDTSARTVSVDGQVLDYDWLVVAAGSVPSYFGHVAWAADAPALKTLDDALAIRARVLGAFEAAERESDATRCARLLSFAIVGGGPTGVELAGTLAEMARHTLPREFRRATPRSARIHLIEAGPRLLPALPDSLSRWAQRKLERMGVAVHLGAPVTAVDGDGVRVGDQRIDVATTLWSAGVMAAPLGAALDVERTRDGRLPVTVNLALAAHPEVFIAGDLAAVVQDGRRVPGVAPAAKQMGRYVARVIRARLARRAVRPFRYRDQGSLASISRASAVVAIGRWRFSGLAGWLFWLVAHIVFLIGFRNRLAVLWNWAWSYLTWQRHARIITTPPRAVAGGAARAAVKDETVR